MGRGGRHGPHPQRHRRIGVVRQMVAKRNGLALTCPSLCCESLSKRSSICNRNETIRWNLNQLAAAYLSVRRLLDDYKGPLVRYNEDDLRH